MTYTVPRMSSLIPAELVEAAAILVRDAKAPEEFLVTYEAAAGELGAGIDPRGDDDPVRWVAAAGYVHKLRGHRPRLSWRIGVSANVAGTAAPTEDHVEAVTDAVAALLRDLTGDDAAVAALRSR